VNQLVKYEGNEKTTLTIEITIFVPKFMNYKTLDLTTDHLPNAGIQRIFQLSDSVSRANLFSSYSCSKTGAFFFHPFITF
jgi:hypothetical protein